MLPKVLVTVQSKQNQFEHVYLSHNSIIMELIYVLIITAGSIH
jgi:hypothetical protein